jgi:hypothetical protein
MLDFAGLSAQWSLSLALQPEKYHDISIKRNVYVMAYMYYLTMCKTH